MRILNSKEKISGFYVYALLNPLTNLYCKENLILPHEPFYVGKGKNFRENIIQRKIDKENRIKEKKIQ
jgi:hypothetical protein